MRPHSIIIGGFRVPHKYRILVGGVLSLMFFLSTAQDVFSYPQTLNDSCDQSVICPGEELVYEVSWLRIKLGQIRIRTTPSTIVNGETVCHAAAYIDSYEGLPFVDLHAIDHTDMDSLTDSRGYHAMEKRDDGWRFETSWYDLPHKKVFIETFTQKERKVAPGTVGKIDTLAFDGSMLEDGLSILYFARKNIHSDRAIVVPTLVYGKLGRTHFSLPATRDQEEIDALKDKKIRVVRFDGKAEFKGLFGLTGDFKGWFSDDVAAVPIKAEMKVIIGSVKIELIEWRRPGWNPPTE